MTTPSGSRRLGAEIPLAREASAAIQLPRAAHEDGYEQKLGQRVGGRI